MIRLDDLMQAIILEAVSDESVNIQSLTADKGSDIKEYGWYCQDLLMRLRETLRQYGNDIDAMNADITEFRKIYDLADEIPSISGGMAVLEPRFAVKQGRIGA